MNMKRYLHFYYWLAAVIVVTCSTTIMSAQTKVTSLSQLKAGSVIKIYPKDHYGDNDFSLACDGEGNILTDYKYAGFGNYWILEDAGDDDYYIKNTYGCYLTYSDDKVTCATNQSSAVKIRLYWKSSYDGICFFNKP